jgi:hypothetical protein
MTIQFILYAYFILTVVLWFGNNNFVLDVFFFACRLALLGTGLLSWLSGCLKYSRLIYTFLNIFALGLAMMSLADDRCIDHIFYFTQCHCTAKCLEDS